MEFYLSKLLGPLLVPPAVNVLLAVLGFVLWRFWRRLGVALVVLAVASLYLLSLNPVSRVLLSSLERYPPLDLRALEGRDVGAIVVLGAGRRSAAPEYGGDTVNELALERLRYGARVFRATRSPVLLTGGRVRGEDFSEALLMKETMVDDFRVPVVWTEDRSRNTAENAAYTSELLLGEGISEVVLVTHAWHMPRAVEAFRNAGLQVLPGPTGFTRASSARKGPSRAWLPTAKALQRSAWAVHEYLGRGWYQLRQHL